MSYLVNIEKVKKLIDQQGFSNTKTFIDKLIDIQSSSFYSLINGRSKYRTTLNMAMRIANALNVRVEDIVFDDNSNYTTLIKEKEKA